MANAYLDKMQTRRSVLKRTRSRADLPALVLYLESVSGQPKRKVIDAEGGEHVIDDTVLQSQYKLVTGSQGKELIEKHWAKIVAAAAAAAKDAAAKAAKGAT